MSKLDVYSDTDWAGRARTRKSTSGGIVYHGAHVLKFWSSTQSTIALSSAILAGTFTFGNASIFSLNQDSLTLKVS